jgi:hypothetical protein
VRTPQLATRTVRILAVPLLLAGVAAGIAPAAPAVAGRIGSQGSAPSFTINGDLWGVAATPATNAWAVGSTISGKTLIVHWNGTTWKRVPSPSLGDYASLYGVTAASATNAWAVGSADVGTNGKTLIVHWNGTVWKRVPSPSPGTYASLYGVAATSATNAWAVGSASSGKTLILHWNGTVWSQVPNPSLKGSFQAVAATSATNAWAVGYAGNPGGAGVPGNNRPLIMHWNGVAWNRVPSHLAPGLGNLRGVAATSAGNAWAVGCTGCLAEGAGDPLIEQWNGTAWKQVPAPSPDSLDGLWGVAATSPANAWAVGTPVGGPGHTTGIVHWNGTTWKPVPSPNPGGQEHVFGVAATSARNAWAVGQTEATTPFKSLISHWNGTAWN